ncbi:hypothetical protein A9Q99_19675 [Gammaproteobacteria bacterium 45_16_T64]|nr:hypothetical protein A9Q99_19675 [Gammaproteobacteria bacterium 45_16_T64]
MAIVAKLDSAPNNKARLWKPVSSIKQSNAAKSSCKLIRSLLNLKLSVLNPAMDKSIALLTRSSAANDIANKPGDINETEEPKANRLKPNYF